MTKKLIVANWKMLPATLAEAEGLVEKLDEHLRSLDGSAAFDLIICPPFVFIEEVAKMLGEGVLAQAAVLGAQDIAQRDEGALTGEVSAAQLAALGVRYVIVGHSERRYKLGETDQTVNAKLKLALAHGLTPVVCLGERTREGAWQDELTAQTVATLNGLTAGQAAHCIIAYEPVWAISSTPGATPDTPASAVQAIALIQNTLHSSFDIRHSAFLYGGSVTAANAGDFLGRPEIRGVLVGGASVRAEEFTEILSIAASL